MGLQSHEFPVVGTWYWDVEHSSQFEIVASDEQARALEIQYFEGDIEEIDIDSWYNMQMVSIAAPKDWTGPYEVDKEQFPELKDSQPYHPLDWNNPVDSFEF